MLARTRSVSCCSILKVSASTWLTANRPIITGMTSSPASSWWKPKVSLSVPELSSTPGRDSMAPSSAAIRPLSSEPPLSEAISISATQTMAKFSHGPKAMARRASGGASSTRANQDSTPPTMEPALPRPSARPGWPALASAWPSRQVMMAFGSPGMRISVAVMSPPLTPPTKMAMSRVTALTLVM